MDKRLCEKMCRATALTAVFRADLSMSAAAVVMWVI